LTYGVSAVKRFPTVGRTIALTNAEVREIYCGHGRNEPEIMCTISSVPAAEWNLLRVDPENKVRLSSQIGLESAINLCAVGLWPKLPLRAFHRGIGGRTGNPLCREG